MAIPKRVLRRAIDRNTVRRIAREAWRAAVLARQVGDRAPGPFVAADATRTDPARPRTILLRLLRRPEGFAVLGYRARKRLWRAELDSLFARAAAGAGLGDVTSGIAAGPEGARRG